VRAEDIEKVIVDRIASLAENRGLLSDLVDEASASAVERISRLHGERKSLESRSSQLGKEIGVLAQAIGKGKTKFRTVMQKIADMEELKAQVDERIMSLSREVRDLQDQVVEAKSMAASCAQFRDVWEHATPEERRRICQLHVAGVEFARDRVKLNLYSLSPERTDRPKPSKKRGSKAGHGGGELFCELRRLAPRHAREHNCRHSRLRLPYARTR